MGGRSEERAGDDVYCHRKRCAGRVNGMEKKESFNVTPLVVVNAEGREVDEAHAHRARFETAQHVCD
jgi:hypothetical protein